MPAKNTKNSKAKKTSGKKSTASTSAPVETASAPVVEPTPVVETAPVVDSTSTATDASSTGEVTLLQQIEADFASLNERLVQFRTMYTSLTTDLRKLQKNMTHMSVEFTQE